MPQIQDKKLYNNDAAELYKKDLGSFFRTVKLHAGSKEAIRMLNINSKDSLLQLKT